MLGRKKKVQDCDYVFGSSTKFQRRMNGFVKADICRQVSVCLHVFCGILFALKPFCDYSLCSVCILPQPAFYSQSVVCILPLVRSPQKTLYQAFRIMKAPKNYFIVNRVLATGCWGLGHYKLFFLFVNAACALFLWGQLVVLTLLAKIFEF